MSERTWLNSVINDMWLQLGIHLDSVSLVFDAAALWYCNGTGTNQTYSIKRNFQQRTHEKCHTGGDKARKKNVPP